MKLIILGILLMLISLWGGAYAMGQFPYPHWANVPAYFSAILLFVVGVACIVSGRRGCTPD